MNAKEDRYSQRGVSSDKKEVHQAIKNLDKGLFPNAFCKIMPDVVAHDADYCNIMHADTAGTKTSLAYLYWKETGDLSVWEGVVQDSIVMNLDDMACVGCVDNILLSSTIGRNKFYINGTVIKTIINASSKLKSELEKYGVNLHLTGGETADVNDIVRTIDIGFTAFARLKRAAVIENKIKPGNVIVGLASFGKASYETEYNSGIGSNGLTSAKHDVLSKYYATKYPESYDSANLKDNIAFTGTKKVTDTLTIDNQEIPIGKLLLSPTRTFLPLMKEILNLDLEKIHGIIHCTGGGQTKVLKFSEKVHIIKDNLFETPPIFRLIQSESGASWEEMYRVFNMGNRMEFYVDADLATEIIKIATQFNIESKIVGRVEASEQNELTIISNHGKFQYQN